MSWANFWVPNLLQATLFAGISAIFGSGVGFLARRWFRQWAAQQFGEQQRATNAAETAAARAGEAADASRAAATHATTASENAQTAGDNSRQANAAIEWLARELAHRDAVEEELKERIDRLLGTRARQLATEQQAPEPEPDLLFPPGLDSDDDPATSTGRHRLHTQRMQAIDEGDPA